jgi:hypothetical protein
VSGEFAPMKCLSETKGAKKMNHHYSYEAAVGASEKIGWRIEDVIGNGKTLDFTKPFMPESLARANQYPSLNDTQKRVLNQIRGSAYLRIFGLVEEFILPFVLDHVRPHLSGNDYRVRAFLQFAGEEAKHIQLFKRFAEDFDRGFGIKCNVIGPPEAVAQAILAHHPLAVALVILHIEWMTQKHYVESVDKNEDLDPLFKSLLRHHWMEESQHAKLDTLMVEALAEGLSEDEISRAVDEYLEIGGFLDAGLKQQVAFDIDTLCEATNLQLDAEERGDLESIQLQANRWTYLGSGMTHPNFLATLGNLSPAGREKIEGVSEAFC